MNIGIYCSAFNLKTCDFDYEFALNNFCNIADEVVIATISDSDGSYDILSKFKQDNKLTKLDIVNTNLKPDFPSFDGAIKNLALQNCFGDILIQMDLDEYIPLQHYGKWRMAANILYNSEHKCFMIPVIDLYKSKEYCKGVGFKWRMHKPGLKRGVVNWAKKQDGTHDIEKSDSCELLDKNDNLVSSVYLVNPSLSIENKLKQIKDDDCIYVHHLGYLNIDRRDKINKAYWQDMWNLEAGREVALDDLQKLDQYRSYKHGLEL